MPCVRTRKPICFKLGVMLDMTELYILISVWMIMMFHWRSQGCKKAWACAAEILMMVDSVREMAMKQSCKYGGYGSWSVAFCCLLVAKHPCNMLVYLRDGSAQTSVCAAWPRLKITDQIFYLTQTQYTGTGPTSPSTDLVTPNAWQGNHWSATLSLYKSLVLTRPGKIPTAQAGIELWIFCSRGGCLEPLGQQGNGLLEHLVFLLICLSIKLICAMIYVC